MYHILNSKSWSYTVQYSSVHWQKPRLTSAKHIRRGQYSSKSITKYLWRHIFYLPFSCSSYTAAIIYCQGTWSRFISAMLVHFSILESIFISTYSIFRWNSAVEWHILRNVYDLFLHFPDFFMKLVLLSIYCIVQAEKYFRIIQIFSA